MMLSSTGTVSCTASVGITRPSSLILAHAPVQNPPADFGFPIPAGLCRLLRAPAGRWTFPTLSLRSLYRRLGPYLQAPILAWPTGCTDHQGTMSLRPPGRIHRAVLAPLPVASSGITTCPNQTIDTTGLVRASPSLTCWNRSLVGCSYTLSVYA